MKFKNQAEFLKETREQLGLSQYKMGTLFGLKGASATAFISNAERGACGLPPKRWAKFHKKTNCQIDVKKILLDFNRVWWDEFETELKRLG